MPKVSNKKFRACTNCKLRKVKCDGYPCLNCSQANTTCVLTMDKRSTRPSNADWEAMKTKIVALESQLDQVSNQNSMLLKVFKKNKIDVELPDVLPPLNVSATAATKSNINNSKYSKPGEFDKIDQEDESIVWSAYGPTSIFNENQEDLASKKTKEETANEETLTFPNESLNNHSNLLTNSSTLGLLNKNPQIIKHIKLFFQYMYPDVHMFVPRETFLIDFYHPKPATTQPNYCTKELVYAICAIGSLIDPEFNQSDSYYNIAKTRLFLNISTPSMTSLQSFILLGLYDIYRCENDSGWLLAGMGLRIGFNLGFHLSPPLNSTISDLAIKFKSRIYWGCFIVDHLLGVILGRPPMLNIEESTIQESDRVPDLEWIKDFNFQELDQIIDVANPLKATVKLFVAVDDAIKNIFITYGNNKGKSLNGLNDLIDKLGIVKVHNERFEQWRNSLDLDLKWTDNKRKIEGIDTLEEKCKTTPKMTHVFCYYLCLLCLNRPFIRRMNNTEDDQKDVLLLEKVKDLETHICNVIVKALRDLCTAMSPYTKPEGSEPGSILAIYASIIGVSTVMILGNSSDYLTNGKRSKWLLGPTVVEREYYYENPMQFQRERELRNWFFTLMKVLENLKPVWLLAGRSFEMVDRKCKNEYGIGYKRAFAAWEKECKLHNNDKEQLLVNNNEKMSSVRVNEEDNFKQEVLTAHINTPSAVLFDSPLEDLWNNMAFDVVDEDVLFGALIPTELDSLFT